MASDSETQAPTKKTRIRPRGLGSLSQPQTPSSAASAPPESDQHPEIAADTAPAASQAHAADTDTAAPEQPPSKDTTHISTTLSHNWASTPWATVQWPAVTPQGAQQDTHIETTRTAVDTDAEAPVLHPTSTTTANEDQTAANTQEQPNTTAAADAADAESPAMAETHENPLESKAPAATDTPAHAAHNIDTPPQQTEPKTDPGLIGVLFSGDAPDAAATTTTPQDTAPHGGTGATPEAPPNTAQADLQLTEDMRLNSLMGIYHDIANATEAVTHVELEQRKDEKVVKAYFASGGHMNDHGEHISTHSNNLPTAQEFDAMVMAAQKKGWKSLNAAGTEAFKENLWLAAQRQNMPLKNFEPSDALKAKAAEEAKARDGNSKGGLSNTIKAAMHALNKGKSASAS
jgi:hypothetical protein